MQITERIQSGQVQPEARQPQHRRVALAIRLVQHPAHRLAPEQLQLPRLDVDQQVLLQRRELAIGALLETGPAALNLV